MIAHCVFLKFRPEVTAADKSAIYAAVAALKPRIPGFVSVTSGPNVSPEGLHKGHTGGFIVIFDGSAARDRYLADPEHAKVGALIVETTGGLDGVFVYDLVIA